MRQFFFHSLSLSFSSLLFLSEPVVAVWSDFPHFSTFLCSSINAQTMSNLIKDTKVSKVQEDAVVKLLPAAWPVTGWLCPPPSPQSSIESTDCQAIVVHFMFTSCSVFFTILCSLLALCDSEPAVVDTCKGGSFKEHAKYKTTLRLISLGTLFNCVN